jgi:hypothetical protein
LLRVLVTAQQRTKHKEQKNAFVPGSKQRCGDHTEIITLHEVFEDMEALQRDRRNLPGHLDAWEGPDVKAGECDSKPAPQGTDGVRIDERE